jgi:hypothetical protein
LFEDLVYATVQHDIGYLDWELAPTLDRKTGLPHTYKTLPCDAHLGLWRKGISWMEPASRFSALIISLHSAGLYERHFDWENEPESNQARVREFITQQQRYQHKVIAALGESPHYELLGDAAVVDRFSYLVGTWDLISLHLCEGNAEPLVLDKVPCLEGAETVQLHAQGPDTGVWGVAPWPFCVPEVSLHFDVREINPPYERDVDLQSDLQKAGAQSVTIRLVPAESPGA